VAVADFFVKWVMFAPAGLMPIFVLGFQIWKWNKGRNFEGWKNAFIMAAISPMVWIAVVALPIQFIGIVRSSVINLLLTLWGWIYFVLWLLGAVH
jgi:predicted permease